MGKLKNILIDRDGMSEYEAIDLIIQAKNDLNERLLKGESPENFCKDWFDLENDHLFELMCL